MSKTEFIEFTSIELLVNSIPFYFGGEIKHSEHQGAVLGMIRLHQMNGIQEKINLPTEKLVTLLHLELDKIYRQKYKAEFNTPFFLNSMLFKHIKEGTKLGSNYEKLVNELALYNLKRKAAILNVQQIFDMAKKNWNIERPNGSWEIAKHLVVQGRIVSPDDGVTFSRGINNERMVWQLKDNPDINIPELNGSTLINVCPDFASKLLIVIKTDIKAWPNQITTLLENI